MKKMENKIFGYLFGVTLFLSGLGVFFYPKFYDRRHGYLLDFTDIRIPFSFTLMILGIFFIITAIKNKSKFSKEKFLICHECKKSFYETDAKEKFNNLCPVCNVELEELEGFYQRHPELK